MDIITVGLLLFSLILLIILSWIWPPDSPWSPWWRTNSRVSKLATKLAKISPRDIVYELGCGEATFLTTAVKSTGANGIGIEIDPTRFLAASLNVRINNLSGKIVLKRKNFFGENLSSATIIFVYLVPKVLEKLKTKFSRELKKGTIIISYKYKFEQGKDERLKIFKKDTVNKLYLYKIS